MLEKEQITPEMHGLIRIPQVEYFVNADIGKRMGAAEKDGKLYREKPFVMGFTDEQLDEFGFAENTEQAEKESGWRCFILYPHSAMQDLIFLEKRIICIRP